MKLEEPIISNRSLWKGACKTLTNCCILLALYINKRELRLFPIADFKKKETVKKCTHMHLFVPRYITLSRGVSIDVACHISPYSSVLNGSLGVHELETSPLSDAVTPQHSWSPSFSFALHHALDKVALSRIVYQDVPKH